MRNLVHRLRRVFIEDGYEQGLAALDEGIQILDEDERRKSTLSHDGIDVEQDINEDNEQDDEEDDHAEPNIEVRRRRARPETVRERTSVLVHHVHLLDRDCCERVADDLLQRRSSRSRASRTETVGESSQRSSTPQQEPQMFVPSPPSVNLPPYYFDPYAPGLSSSYVDHGMPHPQMYPSLPQYMPRRQYFGMVPPPIFGSISSKGESSEAPEETHESTRRDSMQDQLPQQPQPDVQTHRPTRQIIATDLGERSTFYVDLSMFSLQLTPFQNALSIHGLLFHPLVGKPVLVFAALLLTSVLLFIIQHQHELESLQWELSLREIHVSRSIWIAEVLWLRATIGLSSIRFSDFKVFASRFCGLGIDLTCFDVSDVGSSSLLAKLKQCGSLISSANVSVGRCLYGVDEDCRTTVWTYEQNAEDGVLDSFQPDEELRRKKKISFFRRRRDVYKALGPGSEAELATVLAFGSLFTAPYKGSELYIDIHESPRDERIHFLIKKFDAISFVPDILNAGKKFAVEKIKGPFLCAQLRMLDGQFKNHWKTTFAGLEQKLESLKVENRLPIHIFVMTDLPEANWTGTYLGKLARDSDAYRLYNLQEEDEKVVQTARKLVPARRVTKHGFVSREIGENKLQKNCSPGTSPDILLYIEEAVCSCASLGFVGTAGSTIAESIEQMRKNGVCLNKSLVD
ncbi:hypothetical protein Scep_010398 [Stephania cephalantha]|uniref:Uncharacterized protein n=1 Tax=Stephania cephalantha TaxID=152367 RepID=A0AAP0JXE9_9MAGN